MSLMKQGIKMDGDAPKLNFLRLETLLSSANPAAYPSL